MRIRGELKKKTTTSHMLHKLITVIDIHISGTADISAGAVICKLLHRKVPVRNAVHAVHGDAVKAQEPGLHPPIRIVGGAGQGTAADG